MLLTHVQMLIHCNLQLYQAVWSPLYIYADDQPCPGVLPSASEMNNILASSLSRLFYIQGLPCSKYTWSPFWVSIVCIISILSSVNENIKPRAAPVESRLMHPSIFILRVGFSFGPYFVDLRLLMLGRREQFEILTQLLLFSASIVS